jgi:hypothetical protein
MLLGRSVERIRRVDEAFVVLMLVGARVCRAGAGGRRRLCAAGCDRPLQRRQLQLLADALRHVLPPRGVAVWLGGSGSSSPPTTTTRTAPPGSSPTPSTGRSRHGAVTASATLTPGAVNPAVTQVTIGIAYLCVELDEDGQAADRLHQHPQSQADDPVQRNRPAVGLRGDHRVPLELGGAPRDPRNLWPEARPRANT